MRALSLGLPLMLGLLSACADTSSADFDRRMATFVAGPEVQLINGLGVPQNVYETDGRRFLQYDLGGYSRSPSVSPSIGLGFGSGSWGSGVGVGTGIGFGFGGNAYPPTPCLVTFEVRDGRVLNFERRGDNCR